MICDNEHDECFKLNDENMIRLLVTKGFLCLFGDVCGMLIRMSLLNAKTFLSINMVSVLSVQQQSNSHYQLTFKTNYPFLPAK